MVSIVKLGVVVWVHMHFIVAIFLHVIEPLISEQKFSNSVFYGVFLNSGNGLHIALHMVQVLFQESHFQEGYSVFVGGVEDDGTCDYDAEERHE